MQSEKISISLPPSTIKFIENYQVASGIKSRSAVIEEALSLLRDRYLESAYIEANEEIDFVDWEIAIGDGLGDETW